MIRGHVNSTNHVSQNLLNDTTGANRCHTPRNSMAERRVDCQKRALSDKLVRTRANSCQVYRKKQPITVYKCIAQKLSPLWLYMVYFSQC